MSTALRRIGAIVRADVAIRFRRLSTLVVLLALGASAYFWVPDPATGRALLVIDGHRVLLGSAAIGMATACLGSIVIGLFGFYVVSNALRRDVATRCGAVIASTPVRSLEYLVGKVVGNVVFLAAFMTAFMLTAMAMVPLRGEGPLEPGIFVAQYLLLVPGAIVMASTLAVVFESIPLLSGRFGDVVYFFAWIGVIVPGAALVETSPSLAPGVVAYLDPTAFDYMLVDLKAVLHTTEVSIGATGFDPTQAPVAFGGLTLPAAWILPRLCSVLSPLLLVFVALLFFHRFDPARTGRIAARVREGLFRRVQRWVKPLTRPLVAALMGRPRAGRVTLVGAARRDAALALGSFPLAALAFVVVSFVALVMATPDMLRSFLPIVVAVIGVAIADVASRERRAGTFNLVAAAPLLAPRFVRWKALSALLVALLFALVPLAKTALFAARALLPLAVGLLFVVAAATFLGVASSTPKAFLVVFLTFWYIAANDAGRTAFLDFAGFYGAATPQVTATYAALALGFYAAAEAVYAVQHRHG